MQELSIEEKRAQKVMRHQAVFALDFETWRMLVEAFGGEGRAPMIAHRDDDEQAEGGTRQIGERGWYT
jgi:non-structural maintenance of chromosomes element 4